MRPIHGPRLILGLMVLFLAGCSTVVPIANRGPRVESVAADGGRPPKGVYEFDATPDTLNRALPEAMADLKMTYIRTRKDGVVLQADGKTADNRTVNVTIRPGLGKSRFTSHIGWFGDKMLSQALAERAGIRAGLLPAKPIPDEPPSSPDPNPIFSRSAVSDEEMLRDIAEAPYRANVIP